MAPTFRSRRVGLVALMAIALAAVVAAVVLASLRRDSDVVWHDSFAGSTLDPQRWRVADDSTFGDGNEELACLLRRNATLHDGVLRLTAEREATPRPCGSSDSRFPGGRAYSSGMVSTKGLASWDHGRFEIRARLPVSAGKSAGLWPAFWLRPDDGGPGEIDILEAVGTGPRGGPERGVVHETEWDTATTHRGAETRLSFDPSSDFHTYACEWDAAGITWLIDRQQVHHVDIPAGSSLAPYGGRRFFLRLNLAVGGRWPGEPQPSTQLPASFDIDWIRVSQ